MPLGPLTRALAWSPLASPLGGGQATPRAFVLLALVALLAGCQGGASARRGQERCAAQVAAEPNGLLRSLRYGKCLLSIDAVLERERAEAQIRQQAEARRRLAACYANQAEVKSLAQALQAAQQHLAGLQAEPYLASERPRRPDPDLQRGFATYDQELDQERYEQALAQWHQAESLRYERWQASRQRRISADQARQAALARRLKQLNPALFAAPGSLGPPPRLNLEAYGQAIHCQPEPGQ